MGQLQEERVTVLIGSHMSDDRIEGVKQTEESIPARVHFYSEVGLESKDF